MNDETTYEKIVKSMTDLLDKYDLKNQQDMGKYEDCGSK